MIPAIARDEQVLVKIIVGPICDLCPIRAADTLLRASDLALDPDIPGKDAVPIIVRMFVPPQTPAGTSATFTITLQQVPAGTAIEARTDVTDKLLVLARASGLVKLVKAVDQVEARPGDVLTYTINFSNPGVRAVKETEIIDPLSPSVDIVRNAFGAGRDVEWLRGGLYLPFTTSITVFTTESISFSVSLG